MGRFAVHAKMADGLHKLHKYCMCPLQAALVLVAEGAASQGRLGHPGASPPLGSAAPACWPRDDARPRVRADERRQRGLQGLGGAAVALQGSLL